MKSSWPALAGVALLAAASAPLQAYDLPSGLNLGFTSFLDGAPPAGPGFYFQQYAQFQTSSKLVDGNGDEIQKPTVSGGTAAPELDVWVSLSQFTYQSDQPVLFGGKWAFNLLVPYVWLNLKPNDLILGEDGNGLSDLTLGPYLQWDPIMGEDGPLFVHRFELDFIVPTGEYDRNIALNPGNNMFGINPYWAGTLFFAPRWTASWRLHYLWMDSNDDPSVFYPAGTTKVQPGHAVHANFAISYAIVPDRFRAGLNGYFLRQLTESEYNGVAAPNSEEQVIGLGPGLVYHFSKDNHLFLNSYFESATENRPEGMRFNARFVHHF